jgi:hypothetical protein
MIPPEPFRVEVTMRVGDKHERRNHNFVSLQAANAYAGSICRKHNVVCVSTNVVLEELRRLELEDRRIIAAVFRERVA